MPKVFYDESFKLLKDKEIASDHDQENSNVENDNDKFNIGIQAWKFMENMVKHGLKIWINLR